MGAAGSVLQPLPFDPSFFPTYGVNIKFLDEFIEEICGGREALDGLDVTEVCESFVKPLTLGSQSSYCEYLERIGHPAVGEAQVFVSHAWAYKFLDIADALVNHFKDEEDVYVWFDLFSNNQHRTIDFYVDYLANNFQNVVRGFGRTVMVFASWDNPIPLTRAWCLWEVFCTVQGNCTFEIAMTESAMEEFLADISKDPQRCMGRIMTTIDAQNSESSNFEDKKSIHQAIEAYVGFVKLNVLVYERLRAWVIATIKNTCAAVDESDSISKQKYLLALGSLSAEQGKYSEAEEIYSKVYQERLQEYGEQQFETLEASYLLGGIYYSQLRFNLAEELLSKSLRLCKEVFGDRDVLTLKTMKSVALIYHATQRFDLAESLFKECLELEKDILGEADTQTLQTLTFLAFVYDGMRQYSKAQAVLEDLHKIRTTALGDRHQDTLETLCLLGQNLLKQDICDRAGSVFEECLRLRLEVLGPQHVLTLSTKFYLALLNKQTRRYGVAAAIMSGLVQDARNFYGEKDLSAISYMNELGVIYTLMRDFSFGERTFEECLSVAVETLGKEHLLTLQIMSNFGSLYVTKGDYSRGAPLLEEVWTLKKRILGDHHPDTIYSKNILTDCYRYMGDTDKLAYLQLD